MKRVREFHCNKSSDSFCYICGQFTPINQRRPINKSVESVYKLYFKMEIKNQDKCWVPHVVCDPCRIGLNKWSRRVGHLGFGCPMIWRDPINHETNCYICLTDVFGFTRKNRQNVRYATVDSVTLPVPHSDTLPIPDFPEASGPSRNDDGNLDEDSSSEERDDPSDPSYIPDTTGPHILSQGDLNDLTRDLNLSKDLSELLASRLKQWCLLEKGRKTNNNSVNVLLNRYALKVMFKNILDVLITASRQRSALLAQCFIMRDGICCCPDIPRLFSVLNQPFTQHEWRLFIDGSKTSIKAVLLHIGNQKPSVPVAFAIGLKEGFESMRKIIDFIQYRRFNFQIVADFKVIGFLMGFKNYPKFPCFLCEWDSRNYAEHWTRATWPMRRGYTPGEKSVLENPIVPRDRIILPPLHIKLGLMTNFVKAIGDNAEAINYLENMFPRLSKAKIDHGIFVGPQIRKVMHSDEFQNLLTRDQERAWTSFEAVVDGFLGNKRSSNYRQLVERMLEDFANIGAHLSLKLHFLKSHLSFFPDNMGAYSDEHGERFHQDISDMEGRFNFRYIPNMLGEYCWSLLRDTRAMHKRRGRKNHF